MGNIWRQWSPKNEDGSIRWSWHTIERYLKCPRHFELSVVNDLVPNSYNGPLALGTAFHRGLAAVLLKLQALQQKTGKYYTALTDDGLHKLADLAEATINQDTEVSEEDRWTAINLARIYCTGNEAGCGGPRDFAEWRIVAVEEPISADLGRYLGTGVSVPWQQTVDVLVEVGGSAADYWHGYWIIDHKTARSMAHVSVKSYVTDGQAILCTAVGRLHNAAVRGFIPNIVTKNVQPKILREYIEGDNDRIVKFVGNIARWQAEINQWMRVGATDWKRNEASCIGKYGYCEFFAYCHEDGEAGYVPRDELALGERVVGMNPGTEEI